MEVLSVADVYENSTRWQHCGIALIDHISETNQWLMLIPLGDERKRLDICSGDVKDIVYCPKEDVVGLIIKNKNSGMRSLFLKMTTDNEECGTGSLELDYFLLFVNKHSPGLKPQLLSSQKNIQKYLDKANMPDVFTSMYPPRGKKTKINKDGMESLQGWKCCLSEDEESVSCVHRQFRPYFRPYITFVLENMDKGKKRSKKILRNVDNIPKFVMLLSWNHEVHLMKTLGNFFMVHCCSNINCDGFSFLQCSDCMTAHYCSVKCQAQDYDRHRVECRIKSYFREQNYFLCHLLEFHVEKKLGHGDFLRLKTFVRVLNYRVYECFYGALSVTNSRTTEWINRNMLSVLPVVKSKEKMLTMLKERRKHKTKTLKEIRCQVERVYGEDNGLSRVWLRDVNPMNPMQLLDSMMASLFHDFM